MLFPSCLIHRAVALAESKQRRTIVLFDIENPDEPAPLVHDIVTCPGWTQKPLLDGIFGAQDVEDGMLADLLANRSYFWRYFRRGANRRVQRLRGEEERGVPRLCLLQLAEGRRPPELRCDELDEFGE